MLQTVSFGNNNATIVVFIMIIKSSAPKWFATIPKIKNLHIVKSISLCLKTQ